MGPLQQLKRTESYVMSRPDKCGFLEEIHQFLAHVTPCTIKKVTSSMCHSRFREASIHGSGWHRHGSTHFIVLLCRSRFTCYYTLCWQHPTEMRERMLMRFVATSTCEYCTDSDTYTPWAEECRNARFLFFNPPSLFRPSKLGRGQPSRLHGLRSRIGFVGISWMANVCSSSKTARPLVQSAQPSLTADVSRRTGLVPEPSRHSGSLSWFISPPCHSTATTIV